MFWALYGKQFHLNDSFVLSYNYKKSVKYILHPHLVFPYFPIFSITLISNRSYVFWVHDPDYFLPSINPDIFPHAGIRINNKPQIIWIYLRPVYYERLSKIGEMKHYHGLGITVFSDAPCESSADYSFTACLRNSVSRMVGCRLPWDQWTDPTIPECEETRQLMEHDQWHFVLAELYEKERVVNETGCNVPCNYVKYELANQVTCES